jgi:translation elongation factor P/translation initiation factor 5A
MSIPATQLRPGMIIKHNNDLHSVFSVEHRTPGNLRAFIQAKLRNLRTGAMFEHRFRSPDPIEKVNVDEENMEFLYSDGDDYYFMNTENYEQTHLTRDTLGDAVDYLTAESADQGRVFRWQSRGHRVAANRRADCDGSRARPEKRNRLERDQARQDRNRPGSAGSALHQRRRKD